MIPDQLLHDLAHKLHDCTCRWAHEDQCSWHYEIHGGVHDWRAHAHQSALTQASRQLAHVRKLISLYFPLANDLSPESLCNFALELAIGPKP